MGRIDDERQQRLDEARARRIEAVTTAAMLGASSASPTDQAGIRRLIAGILDELREQMYAHAAVIEANKATGWKSNAAKIRDGAPPLLLAWAAEFRTAGDGPAAPPRDVADPTPLPDLSEYTPTDTAGEPTEPDPEAVAAGIQAGLDKMAGITGGLAATAADVTAYLAGETDELGPVVPVEVPPVGGGFVTPERAEAIRESIESDADISPELAALHAEVDAGWDAALTGRPTADLDANPDMAHVHESAPEGDMPQVPEIVEPTPAAAAPAFLVPTIVEPPTVVRRERLTYPQFLQIAVARPEPERWSHSSVSTMASCGGRWVMRREERPMWSGVGGTAFHKFVEQYETRRNAGAQMNPVEEIWEAAFAEAIAETEAEQPWAPRASWYVANRGRENEDWWRVEGLEMCRTYVDMVTPGREVINAPEMLFPIAPGRDSGPMIEQRFEVTVAGKPFVAVIDQVRYDHAGQRLIIVDPKSGSRKPSGPHQLVEYAHVMSAALGIPDTYRIDGCYYMARTGTTVSYSNLRSIEDWAGFEYRVGTAHRTRAAHIYNFNPGSLCGSCGSNDRCPANGGGAGS